MRAKKNKKYTIISVIFLIVCILLFVSYGRGRGISEKFDEKAYLTIRCDSALELKNQKKLSPEVEKLISEDGIILAKTKVKCKKGESVLDILIRECKKNKIHMSYQGDTSYGSAYIEAINNLYEKDCGKRSGWMYKVDGKFPMLGTDKFKIKGGENIEFVYTCDNGKDVGAGLEIKNE